MDVVELANALVEAWVAEGHKEAVEHDWSEKRRWPGSWQDAFRYLLEDCRDFPEDTLIGRKRTHTQSDVFEWIRDVTGKQPSKAFVVGFMKAVRGKQGPFDDDRTRLGWAIGYELLCELDLA